ncbi:hypothetical protein B0H12DRAFT_1230496 [Mycena haematopus]|nr:hypothetical protein B0H12DRAFT_1230496 [Mycena haematopus]
MFGGGQRLVVHDENSYLANRKRIEDMQKIIDQANALNEQGKQNYEKLASELQRKIQEGEEARRTLAALQSSRQVLSEPKNALIILA